MDKPENNFLFTWRPHLVSGTSNFAPPRRRTRTPRHLHGVGEFFASRAFGKPWGKAYLPFIIMKAAPPIAAIRAITIGATMAAMLMSFSALGAGTFTALLAVSIFALD